jgi:hypothetical protein|tara:strand:- start:1635 stop:2210 length:576 start_codon:yes stop_codon:yes gene_type:complete
MAKRKNPAERPGTPISNRNFLAPTGFKFSLKRCPSAAFFCNQANIPSLDLGIAQQTSYLKDLDIPGDKIVFGDLNLRFLVDEDLFNYMEIQNWIRGLGYPEKLSQLKDLAEDGKIKSRFGQAGENIYSDATLQILSNNLVPKFQVMFKDVFPYSLSTISFDATDTDIDYFTAEVSFKYTIYDMQDMSGNSL